MHAPPELFPPAPWRPAAAGASPGVRTPLGEVEFTATVDGHPLRLGAAAPYRSATGARVWVWEGGVFRAELLRCRPRCALPADIEMTGREAAMWRLRASERPAECEVRCRWSGATGRRAGPPESGEHLVAQLWADRGQRVSVGTPVLGAAVHALPDGFAVSAALERAASFETHFVVAWWAGRPGDDATRLAVDCTASQVLAGITAPAA